MKGLVFHENPKALGESHPVHAQALSIAAKGRATEVPSLESKEMKQSLNVMELHVPLIEIVRLQRRNPPDEGNEIHPRLEHPTREQGID